jgi:hypothetical protein
VVTHDSAQHRYVDGQLQRSKKPQQRSPKGNRHMRRILNQCANAAVKHKGSIFEILYRRQNFINTRRRLSVSVCTRFKFI